MFQTPTDSPTDPRVWGHVWLPKTGGRDTLGGSTGPGPSPFPALGIPGLNKPLRSHPSRTRSVMVVGVQSPGGDPSPRGMETEHPGERVHPPGPSVRNRSGVGGYAGSTCAPGSGMGIV